MLTKPTPRFVAIQSSYWACYCCIISFSSVYLLDRGFSNAQVGLVISLGGLLSALLQPRVSRAADRLQKLSLRLFCAGVAGIFPFFANSSGVLPACESSSACRASSRSSCCTGASWCWSSCSCPSALPWAWPA